MLYGDLNWKEIQRRGNKCTCIADSLCCAVDTNIVRQLLFSHSVIIDMFDLCDPMDRSLPGSSVHGISQARIWEWAAISFSGDLPNSGIQPTSPALAGRFSTTESPEKPKDKKNYKIEVTGQ